MMTEQKTTSTRTRPVELRLIEAPAAIALRKRRLRQQRKRESRVIGVMVGGIAFLTTILGLYVNEHAALNSRNRLAAKIAADNVRLKARVDLLTSQANLMELALKAPSLEKTKALGLELEVAPRYVHMPSSVSAR